MEVLGGKSSAMADRIGSLMLDCVVNCSFLQILLSSALHSWCTHAKEHELSDKTQTAWKAFLCKVFNLVEQKLPVGMCSIDGEVGAIRNKLKIQLVKEGSEEKTEVPEMWHNRYKSVRRQEFK